MTHSVLVRKSLKVGTKLVQILNITLRDALKPAFFSKTLMARNLCEVAHIIYYKMAASTLGQKQHQQDSVELPLSTPHPPSLGNPLIVRLWIHQAGFTRTAAICSLCTSGQAQV